MALSESTGKTDRIRADLASLEFLTENDWGLLASRARQLRFGQDEEIIRQDSPVHDLLIFRRGVARVEIVRPIRKVVARLGMGQTCGEMSFLEDRRASASVIAETEVEADAVEFAELRRIFQMFPHLGSRFYQSMAVTLSRRLRDTSAKLAEASAAGK